MSAAPVLTDVLTSAFLYDLHSITFWVYSGVVLFAVAGNLWDLKDKWAEFMDPDEYAYQQWKEKRQRREEWNARYKHEQFEDERKDHSDEIAELSEGFDRDEHYAKKRLEEMAEHGDPDAIEILEIDDSDGDSL